MPKTYERTAIELEDYVNELASDASIEYLADFFNEILDDLTERRPCIGQHKISIKFEPLGDLQIPSH